MRRNEMRAGGRLAAHALADASALVEQLHAGIAERVFSHTPASPTRAVHAGITQAVYAGVKGGLRGVMLAAGEVATALAPEHGPSLSSHPRAALALGVLNGVSGDRVAAHAPELARGMEIRSRRHPVSLDPVAIAAAFPDASERIAVFVHGLGETEDAWRLVAGGPSYGTRLRDELCYTPVYVRYNGGLHVSDNGQSLARLLEELTLCWPKPVEEIVLIGHSMGGLVARSACHYGERDGMWFTASVKHVFCLGAPHLGAELEKGVNMLSWGLRQLPETRALSELLNRRSAGIKDLRYGSLVEEDWSECDADELLRDRCTEIPFLPGAGYYFIAATIAPPGLGYLVGDLLVRVPSASGRGSGSGRCVRFELRNGRELTGVSHFQLLGHPAVYAQLHAWLSPDADRTADQVAL